MYFTISPPSGTDDTDPHVFVSAATLRQARALAHNVAALVEAASEARRWGVRIRDVGPPTPHGCTCAVVLELATRRRSEVVNAVHVLTAAAARWLILDAGAWVSTSAAGIVHDAGTLAQYAATAARLARLKLTEEEAAGLLRASAIATVGSGWGFVTTYLAGIGRL